jgi:hypothetical protein
MKDFTYIPFKSPKAEIRLVGLLPLDSKAEQGSHQLELRCSIQTVSLDDNPTYTALSYT